MSGSASLENARSSCRLATPTPNGITYNAARIFPFHIFRRDGRIYLFASESVAAHEIDERVEDSLYSSLAAQGALTEPQFALLANFGLVENPDQAINTRRIAEPTEHELQSRKAHFIQTLVLNVIQSCNLRCHYCFAGDGSYGNSGRMSVETARAAVDWYIAQHAGEGLAINFFGGEPLANFSLIADIVDYSAKSAATSQKPISFSITTNGTLVTRQIASFLAEHRFRIAISIDGPRDIHNQNRPSAGGKGSFDAAMKGMGILRAAGNDLVARCTLYGNVNEMSVIRGFLEGLGINEIYIAKASPPSAVLPNATSSQQKYRNPELLAAVVANAEFERRAALEARERGVELTNTVAKLSRQIDSHARQTYACGVGKKITSVGIDGGLYACHRFTNDQSWRVGNVQHGLNAERFVDRSVDENPTCKQCWAKYVCGGGCRHDNFTSTGDAFQPDPDFCIEMKSYVESAIILACESTKEVTRINQRALK